MEPVKDIVHVERADDLTQPQTLERIVGSVSSVVTEPLKTAGFSGSEHTLVKVVLRDGDTRRLILKRTRLNIDWTHRLSSGSRGREAALLATRDFIGVWEIFECPYVAFAESPEETALLMNDLTPFLMPDVRQPLDDRQEDLIITTLAKMHATYWKSPLLETSWLAAPSSSWQVLGPERLGQEWAMQLLHPGMRETVRHGWEVALRGLPQAVLDALSVPGTEIERNWSHLPKTLVHGDVKVANFAIRSDGRVSAIDWALVGRGLVSSDLGWYLAVNATRLAESKEEFIRQYRTILQRELSFALDDSLWKELVAAAILIGARMLLWSKAHALDSGSDAARVEWGWWRSRLEAACLDSLGIIT